jgi:hypothetical protein
VCLIDWTVKATDVAIVLSTIAGPIFAVWASEWRQAQKALHDRKEWVFRTLWSTRSAKLKPEHVQALNHIDFAFPEKDYPSIADAWHLYNAHLNSNQGTTPDSSARWHETANNRLEALIHLMASDLKVSFSKSLINQPSYHPIAFAESEQIQREIQVALLGVLSGETPITVRAVEPKAP